MLLRLNIELRRDWVLDHRSDDVLPVKALAEEIVKKLGCKVGDESLMDFTIELETQDDPKAVKGEIMEIFSAKYGDGAKDAITVSVLGEGEDEQQPQKKDSADERHTGERTQQGTTDKSFESPRERRNEDDDEDELTPEKALESIKALAGAEELVRLANELIRIAPEAKTRGLEGVLLSRTYLFSVSDGCGFSTATQRLTALMRSLGLGVGDRVREYVLPPRTDKPDQLDAIISKLLSPNSSTKRAVFALDISEWMNRTDSVEFKALLKAIESNKNCIVVFFRIPFVERELVEHIGASLNDILTTKLVSFPPASREQMLEFAVNELKQRGFSVRKAALDPLWLRITEEKSDGRFYGIKTVKKVVDELIYAKLLKNADSKKGSDVITENDAMKLCRSKSQAYKSGQQMLDELVGNEAIKTQVNEIVAQIQLARLANEDTPSIHMRFVGNPGTGKTTVARIVGKILKEKGILRIGNFIECHGRDLCGRYVGETAPKTASICRDAYGSVLFIDEAYSLFRGGESSSADYGQEALDTLIAEMENHRDDFVVIMAGYTDDMEKLMEGNRGLRSRMPYTVEFPNFSREQLYEIFLTMLNSNIKSEDAIKDCAKTYFDTLPEDLINSKEFSNGRFVRNLYERIWAKAALRCQLAGQKEVVMTAKDFEMATADKEFSIDLPKKSKFGFY